ncbi:hypothetical protein ACVW1C_005688 [Bradyrhizobium sp. USDA 4011]
MAGRVQPDAHGEPHAPDTELQEKEVNVISECASVS